MHKAIIITHLKHLAIKKYQTFQPILKVLATWQKSAPKSTTTPSRETSESNLEVILR